MKITVLKETKIKEGRVALIPDQAKKLIALGHSVWVQHDAGAVVGFSDEHYASSGATIFGALDEGIGGADLILKVKEPTLNELENMNSSQILFCYLHLAAVPLVFKKILERKITALAYETVQLKDGSLPLLQPMSEIAGKLATQNGAHFLRADQGGRGILLGGTEKVKPANVLILGAGIVGQNAARIAIGMGANVTLLDISKSRLQSLKKEFGKKCKFQLSSPSLIARLVPQADLVIGAVLLPGARAPKLVTEDLVYKMCKGSVIVDVAVDQGGCIETSQVTSHDQPIVVKHGVLHYGVPNIPGSVPVTGTMALTRETFKYIKSIAVHGLEGAIKRLPELKLAINCQQGEIIHPGLKEELFRKK